MSPSGECPKVSFTSPLYSPERRSRHCECSFFYEKVNFLLLKSEFHTVEFTFHFLLEFTFRVAKMFICGNLTFHLQYLNELRRTKVTKTWSSPRSADSASDSVTLTYGPYVPRRHSPDYNWGSLAEQDASLERCWTAATRRQALERR